MKKTVILLVPTLQLGGQERICAQTADMLMHDYNVFVVVFNGQDAVFCPNCEIVDLNVPAETGKINKILNALRRARVVKRIRKEKSADYVYSFGMTANLINVLSRGTGKTLIGLRGYSTAITKNFLSRYIYKHCDAIIGCAEETCAPIREWKSIYANKIECLYNPLDIVSVKKSGLVPVKDYAFSESTIVSHGRLEGVKNWPRLIKAFSIVKRQVENAQLLIIGEGSYRDQLQQLIDFYDLHEAVTLIGFRQNPFAYLAKSRLYVLPSYSEGFPNSLVEGMTFLPTISVDCKSGPREILSSASIDTVANGIEQADYGILVRPAANRIFHQEITEDDELLAEAILEVLQNPKLEWKMKTAARTRAMEFSCEKYRRKLIEIFENK